MRFVSNFKIQEIVFVLDFVGFHLERRKLFNSRKKKLFIVNSSIQFSLVLSQSMYKLQNEK